MAISPLDSVYPVIYRDALWTKIRDDAPSVTRPSTWRWASIFRKGSNKAVATTTDLLENYPNPFNAETQIRFTLATESAVHLKIFDVMGRTVRTLVAHHYPSGAHSISWDGRDDNGASVASGVYIYKLKTVDAVLTQRMMLLR